MTLKYLLLGFFAKTVASLDETVTKVPVAAVAAKTTLGKVAFVAGSLMALFVSLVIAGSIASVISGFAYMRYVLAGFVLLVAFSVRFDVFIVREKKFSLWGLLRFRAKRRATFFRLVGISFLISLVTLIDDTVAYLPLLAGAWSARLYVIGGIVLSTLIQLYFLIYFAETLQKFRYAKEVSFYGLLFFAALIFIGVV